MGQDKQSEGRDQNGATPTDQWQSKGVSGDRTKASDAAEASNPSTQPYGVQSDDQVERTGRTEAVTGQTRSFAHEGERDSSDPNDLTGPAGDPVEGKDSPNATGADPT